MQENNNIKHSCFTWCFQMYNKRLQLKSFIIWVRIYIFLKNYVTSEGAVPHIDLYYQQFPIARYKESLLK